MARYKTSELQGALLDAAVAKAEGLRFAVESYMTNPPKPAACWLRDEQGKPLYTHGLYAPSTNWAQAGPIIERERIVLIPPGADPHLPEGWTAGYDFRDVWDGYQMGVEESGSTPLIAAMRAYTASVFGDEVELP